MRRALELAASAAHATSPNPMVGGVVLDPAGSVVGEGFHQRAGEGHGERIALLEAGVRARGGTLYVNLEPCSFEGRTPPCCDLVVDSGIRRVVVAMVDPDTRVAGAGIERLRTAGIAVEVGVLADAARSLNRFYVKHRSSGRPYVTAKFAMSLDGRIATSGGDSRWISGAASREEGHRLRRIHDAILVGAGTVLVDDPELTSRLPEGVPGRERHPLRVVVDSTLRLPATAKLLAAALPGQALVATTERATPERVAMIRATGAEVVILAGAGARVDLNALFALLAERGILSVLVEGGGEVHGELFRLRMVDEVVAFVAPLVIGDGGAPGPVAGPALASLAQALRLGPLDVQRVGEDLMIRAECSPGS